MAQIQHRAIAPESTSEHARSILPAALTVCTTQDTSRFPRTPSTAPIVAPPTRPPGQEVGDGTKVPRPEPPPTDEASQHFVVGHRKTGRVVQIETTSLRSQASASSTSGGNRPRHRQQLDESRVVHTEVSTRITGPTSGVSAAVTRVGAAKAAALHGQCSTGASTSLTPVNSALWLTRRRQQSPSSFTNSHQSVHHSCKQ